MKNDGRGRFIPVLALVWALYFLMRTAAAQSVYGQISGRLTSASGNPVSRALVTATAVSTEAHFQTTSDDAGYFKIVNMAPDLYQINVRADSSKSYAQLVAVSADSVATVNGTLQTGDPNVVSAPPSVGGSALQLERTDVSILFDSLSVSELPLLDENLTRLQLLVPGAAAGRLAIPPNQNPQGGVPVNLNGQQFSGSAFQLDGTENRDPLEGIVVINPPLDTVREIKVTTQGYNAEFGESTSGVVTVQTKSGNNSWHGDGFGFRRTGFGQSKDPFASAGVPATKYGIFGGSVGGPMVMNKLFFFGGYQGTRSSQGANLLLNVPSSTVLKTCLGPSAPAGTYCNLGQYTSKPLVAPLPEAAFNCPSTIPVCIPNSDVSAPSVTLLNLLPRANHLPTDLMCHADSPADAICNNYLAHGQEAFDNDQADLRADYNVNARLRAFVRYSFGEFYDNGPPAFGTALGGPGVDPSNFAGVARARNQGVSSGFTYGLSSNVLTDFRFGFFRSRLSVDALDYGQTPNLGTPGIPGIFASDTGNPLATGMPDFQIAGGNHSDYLRLGYSGLADTCFCPLREREQQFQFVNNWTRVSGRHTFKWGADLRFLQNNRLNSARPPTGYFDFSPTVGVGLATFLTGFVTSFDRTVSSPHALNAGEHQKRFGFYGQDTWRVNSRLILNYGLRWEIYFPQTVTGKGGFLIPNLSNHDPATTYIDTPSSSGAAGGVSGNLTNFAPRLGIAYQIDSSSVIRAGYARSFDAGYAGDIFGIAATQNPSVSAVQSIQSENFYLLDGPPHFNFPSTPRFSLLALAQANLGDSQPPLGEPSIPASGTNLYALPGRVRVPTVDSWNLTFQHELTAHLYFELGYIGDKGTYVFTDSANSAGATYYNLNQPSLSGIIVNTSTLPATDRTYCRLGNKGSGLFGTFPNQYCLLQASFRSFYKAVPPKNQLNALTQFNPNNFSVFYFGNNANDNYNSLQVKASKSFTGGYSFLAHYTWSKGLDYDSNYFAVDPRIGYGPDTFDIRHRFVMTNIWDLPIGTGKALLGNIGPTVNRIAGGWTISAITLWRSGFPFTPSYSNCVNDTDTNAPCRPNLVGPVHISGSREQYFTTTGGQALNSRYCSNGGTVCGVNAETGMPAVGLTAGPWQRPGAGQIGNVGRNSFTGPGFFQSDLALAKAIPVSERVLLRFRADGFNIFNKVNLANPNPCVDCTSAGIPTGGVISALAAQALQRTLQFSVRIVF